MKIDIVVNFFLLSTILQYILQNTLRQIAFVIHQIHGHNVGSVKLLPTSELFSEEEEEEEENSLLLDANVTWGNILASCCGFKAWSRQGLGTCLVEVQGGGWLPVEGTSQDEVVDEP